MENNQTTNPEVVAAVKAAIISTIYPVGAIYISTNSVNPGDLFGGIWEPFAEGRTIIGAVKSDKEFIAGTMGGSSTHILSVEEMPSHTHIQNAHNHLQKAHGHGFESGHFRGNKGEGSGATVQQSGGESQWIHDIYQQWPHVKDSTAENIEATATNQNTGGDNAHNILQPYIVTYVWKRVC